MASLGVVEMGSIVTRWMPAGARFNMVTRRWWGARLLCTREGRFELPTQKDCAAHGLNSAGFAVIEMGQHPSAVVTFK